MSREGEVSSGVEGKKLAAETDHDESPEARPYDLCSKVMRICFPACLTVFLSFLIFRCVSI